MPPNGQQKKKLNPEKVKAFLSLLAPSEEARLSRELQKLDVGAKTRFGLGRATKEDSTYLERIGALKTPIPKQQLEQRKSENLLRLSSPEATRADSLEFDRLQPRKRSIFESAKEKKIRTPKQRTEDRLHRLIAKEVNGTITPIEKKRLDKLKGHMSASKREAEVDLTKRIPELDKITDEKIKIYDDRDKFLGTEYTHSKEARRIAQEEKDKLLKERDELSEVEYFDERAEGTDMSGKELRDIYEGARQELSDFMREFKKAKDTDYGELAGMTPEEKNEVRDVILNKYGLNWETFQRFEKRER